MPQSGNSEFRAGFYGALWLLIGGPIAIAAISLGVDEIQKQANAKRSDDAFLRSSPDPCSTSGVWLDNTAMTESSGYVHLTGIVHHSCQKALGVELKWTVYNGDGTVAFSQEFWPAHSTNIAPDAPYPFETLNRAPASRSRFEVTPVRVSTW